MNLGWQCPSCGKCWAPWVSNCDCHTTTLYDTWVVCPTCGACYKQGENHICTSIITIDGGTTG